MHCPCTWAPLYSLGGLIQADTWCVQVVYGGTSARRAARRPIFWWPHFSHAPHAWSCSSRGPRSCQSELTPALEALWIRIWPTIRTARARHPMRPLRASSFWALGPKPEAAPGYHGANQERLVRGGDTRSCPDRPHRLSCRSGPYSLRRFPRPS